MADVSHELDALRFVVDSPLSSKVAMFNKQTQQHQQQQLLNPFSTASGRASPKPTFSKDEYGKPLAGSLTEMRGQKANMHVLREMLELCQIIDSEGYNVKDEPKMRVIPFGELFNIYNYISDKVVGILLRARKHKLVEFEGEILFQRRDDDVPIFLLKPILEIRHELEAKIEEIKRGGSPAPQATSVLLDKSAHKQKLASRGSTPSASPGPSKPATPAHSKASSPAPPDVARVGEALAQQEQKSTNIKHNTQASPELTITTVPEVTITDEPPESKEQFDRLEGGQEGETPANLSKIDATAEVSRSETETEINVNQLAGSVLEPVIAENIEILVPISAGITTNSSISGNVVEVTTNVNEADAVPIGQAVSLVETSAEAALKETTHHNEEEDPQK